MLDKIMYVNQNEMYLIFTNREPVRLYSDENVLDLYISTFISSNPEVKTLKQYYSSMEDTAIIELEDLKEAA